MSFAVAPAAPPLRGAATLAGEVRATARLALPLIAGQLCNFGMTVAEVILAGHLGAHVLGTVSLGAALFNIASLAAIGVNAAVAPSVAQLDGARLRHEVGPLFRQALVIAAALGVLLTVAVFFGGPPLAAQFGFAPDLARDVGDFLRRVAPAALMISVFCCCRGLSDGLSRPRPTMAFGLLGLIVLLPVGYALMYGAFGMPALGARGAAYALVAATTAQAGAFAAWLRFSGRYEGIGWHRGPLRPDRDAIVGLLRIGLPMAVSLLLEASLFSAAGLVIGLFGEVAESAHQVALNVAALTFMVPLGIATATTVRVGNAAGRGDAIGVRRAGLSGMGLALLTQSATGGVMLLAPEALAHVYTDQPDVLAGAATLLRIAGVFQLSDGLQVSAIGALRGLKDTRRPVVITAVAYWGIGFPVALVLAFRFGFGPSGMWFGLIAGLTVAAGLLSNRFLTLSRRLASAWPG
jgi:MATE family multidrug resistance protein